MQAVERPEPPPDDGAAGGEATEGREKDLIGNLCSPATKENINMNSVNDSCSLINQERSNTEKLTDNIGVQSDVPARGLPPGWLKEFRFRKASKKTKKDPFYIEPKTGYAFRSLKDVSRYMETGDIRKCANKPQIRTTSEMNAIAKQSHLEAVDSIPAAVSTKPKKRGRGRKQITAKTEPVTKELNLELNPEAEPQLKRHKRDHHSTPRKPKAIKELTVPARASPRLAALRASHAPNAGLADLSSDAKKSLSDQPQAEFDAQKETPQKEAPEKLESNVSVETTDKPASPISSIFGSSWSDPCIEFAFKTLTGDIPDLGGSAKTTDINCSTSAYEGTGMPKTSDKLYPGNELHRQVGNWGKS